jgi:sterol desaturase/sphingolipid hydroxylase (fatty acid hydroxylase superfamily)
VNAILSTIGLALDFVGAVFLVIGLFRPVRPTFPGYAYAPDDAARDAAFGVAGGTLLLAGFVFQSLTYFGLSPKCAGWVNAIAWAAALVVGFAFALVVYEVTHRLVFDRRRAAAARKWHDIAPYPLDRRRGLWFWRPKDE